ncbi:MAG: hypothetical protein PHH37_02630 [Paludibacter sp.]|nr:hypothetical protein [Paludibacter sp.]
MNKINIATIVALLLFLSSCKNLDKLTQFNMNFTQTVSIEPTFKVNTPFTIPTPAVTSNSSSTFSANNTSKDLVEEINLSELKLTVESPEDEDFSILQSIEVYISADGETDTKIAWLDSIPASANTIMLNVSDADLKEFIFKDEFTLKVKTVTDEVNTEQYDIRIDAKLHVNAKILGI